MGRHARQSKYLEKVCMELLVQDDVSSSPTFSNNKAYFELCKKTDINYKSTPNWYTIKRRLNVHFCLYRVGAEDLQQ